MYNNQKLTDRQTYTSGASLSYMPSHAFVSLNPRSRSPILEAAVPNWSVPSFFSLSLSLSKNFINLIHPQQASQQPLMHQLRWNYLLKDIQYVWGSNFNTADEISRITFLTGARLIEQFSNMLPFVATVLLKTSSALLICQDNPQKRMIIVI